MIATEKSKIGNFIESLNLPESIARVLLETEEDCKSFYADFFNRNRYIVDDLLDYREHKISKSKMTVDLFVKECYNIGMKQSFESTFYQSFTDRDISLVQEAILDNRTSLIQLFQDFKKNPNKNILKNVL